MDDARISASWDDNAELWSDVVRSDGLESRRLVTNAAVIDAVVTCGGRRVLDVGCGEGWLARALSARGMDVTGFDGSAALIERAIADGGANYVALDYDTFVAQPQTVGGDFDSAVCNFSLLGENIAPLLGAIRRVVRPQGSIVIQTVHPFSSTAENAPYENGWREETFDNLAGKWTAMPWYQRTVGSWIEQLHAAGWSLESCREPLHPQTGRPVSLILSAVA